MPSLSPEQLQEKAADLVGQLAQGCSAGSSIGSFSAVAYESAWVSLVQKKEDNGDKKWRFPECFQYLLDTQDENGGWNGSRSPSEVDAILNALAALLALKKHKEEPLNCEILLDLETRISKATIFLQAQLRAWDVESSDHVGFEVLVPTLLQLLESEGISFKDILGLPALMSLNSKKLSKFSPDFVYGPMKSTLIHSLEALVGRIDFDKVSHHKVSGSFMGSPAATAAYLIHSSKWDEEAEAYLANVIADGSGKGSGGMPSAYPTPFFELTWALSTLLLSGFSIEDLGSENVKIIGDFLEHHLGAQNGLLGFAPELLSDSDDTAKALLSLQLIGKSPSPVPMINEFDGVGHFRTYELERNPSFSANANALVALLYTPEPGLHLDQISKTASFLCDAWWEGTINDKWNLSPQYPMMLLSQALTRLLRLWDEGRLSGFPSDLLRDKIPVVLYEMLVQTRRSQDSDGSWGGQSKEVTAYSILTLNYLAPLPWATALLSEVHEAIAIGKKFLNEAAESWDKPDTIWIEKVSYGSAVLCQTYCLAAMNSKIAFEPWRDAVQQLTSVSLKAVETFVYFFSTLPLFSQMPKWQLRAALIEGYLFLSKLKRQSEFIFPELAETDEKYLEYIPFTWTASNYLQKTPLSASLLWEMMVISMLNYQADEYMEAVVGKHFESNLEPVKGIIHELCTPPDTQADGNGARETHTKGALTETRITNGNETKEKGTSTLTDIKSVLTRFITYTLTHPTLQTSSPHDISRLRTELHTFLLAHVTHISDNSRFTTQSNHSPTSTASFLSPRTSYFDWVRTTSAEHTSCAYSFAFFSCLASKKGRDCFPGVTTKYFAQDLCTHLAVMCRQYNDFGSIIRDRDEKNINSINFPEFHSSEVKDGGGGEKEKRLKAELFELAEYERECLGLARSRLEGKAPKRVLSMFGLFMDVTDLYGQIYVARDIGVATGGVKKVAS